jgi:hypothetical protein
MITAGTTRRPICASSEVPVLVALPGNAGSAAPDQEHAGQAFFCTRQHRIPPAGAASPAAELSRKAAAESLPPADDVKK